MESSEKRTYDESRQRKQAKLLTDVDHYFTLREPCVASLRSDRHQIGMTDRHHRNAQKRNRFNQNSEGEHQGCDSDEFGHLPPLALASISVRSMVGHNGWNLIRRYNHRARLPPGGSSPSK